MTLGFVRNWRTVQGCQEANNAGGGESFRPRFSILQTETLKWQFQAATLCTMSTEAIRQVVQELETLPESDQRRVLNFLTTLKRNRGASDTRASVSESNPALAVKDGLLIFTGKVETTQADWVQFVRDERDEELMSAVIGQTPRA
jgi:hypothetical protein